ILVANRRIGIRLLASLVVSVTLFFTSVVILNVAADRTVVSGPVIAIVTRSFVSASILSVTSYRTIVTRSFISITPIFVLVIVFILVLIFAIPARIVIGNASTHVIIRGPVFILVFATASNQVSYSSE